MIPYEVMEHTADIGLRVYGRDLPDLFANAARGFFNLVTDTDKIRSPENPARLSFHLKAENEGDLLLAWLRELLFTFSAQKLVLKDFQFGRLSAKELEASAAAYRFDPARDEQRYEVKAVTYHQFKIEKLKDGWTAEVIFDI